MTTKTEKPNRRRKWLLAAGAFVLLLIIGWFVLTSGPVVKALVLPRVAAALHAELTVEQLSLSPFSGIDLKQVKLSPVGGQPLAEIAGVKVRYQLFKLIRGELAIDEVVVDHPRFTIRQRADGGSDLSDWLAKLRGGTATPAVGTKTSAPIQLKIGKVSIRDGAVRYELVKADGFKDVWAIDALELGVDQVRNGATSEIKLSAALQVEANDASGKAVESLKASAEWTGKIGLGGDVSLEKVDAQLKVTITSATGRFAQAHGLGALLSARGSIKQLDDLTLSFLRGPTETGRVQVKGGYDAAAGNGTFDLSVSKLPPVVLELVAMKSGLAFELADFSATNRIAIGQRGKSIGAAGEWKAQGLTAKNQTGSTPTLDVSLNYDTEIEAASSRALIKALTFTTRQNGQPLVDLHVAKPFRFSWSGQPGSEAGSTIALNIAQLRLRDWRPFIGELPFEGVVAAQIGIESKELGQRLAFNASASLEQGQFGLGTNRVEQLSAVLKLAGELDSFRDLQLSKLDVGISRAGKSIAQAGATGQVGLSNLTATVQTTIKGELAALAGLMGGLPVKLTSGEVSLVSSVDYAAAGTSLKGALSITGLATEFEGAKFKQVEAKAPFELALKGDSLDWKLSDASISEGGAVAVRLASAGQLNLKDQSGSIDFTLPLISERLVNPFLAVYTPQQRLRSAQASVAFKGELSANGRQRWSIATQSTNIVLVGANNVPLVPSLGSRSLIEVELDFGGGDLLLKRWEGNLFADGVASGELLASGEVRSDGRKARLSAKLSGVNEHALRPLASFVMGQRQVERANLAAEFDLDYEAIRPSHLRAKVELRDLRISDPARRFPDSMRELDLNLRARVASNRLDLAESSLQLTPSDGLSNRIDIVGWVDFARPSAIRGDLAMRSPGIDLSPIYALLEPDGSATNAPANGVESVNAKPAKGSDANFSPPLDRLDLAVDVRQLRLRELVISNWVARATVRSNALEVGVFSLRVNESPINVRLHATNSAGASTFDVATEIEALRLAPVVRAFSPDWQGLAEADLYTSVRLRGSARAGQSLMSAAVGDIYLGITNANFQPLSPRWRNTLRPVGLLLQSPELFSSPVNWAYYHSQLTNQALAIDHFTVISDAYVMDAGAAITLADDFKSSVIPRTPVDLYLSRNLITQMGLLKGADTNQLTRYVKLPKFMHISGTIGEPAVETDKLKLTGMTIGKAGDFVGGTAGDVLKKAGGVTESIGGVLSGRKIFGGEKEATGVVGKGIEGVFDVVGGILGGTGKAVEKGTGAVTGTKVVEEDVLKARLAAFDWPRIFTNAPNALPAAK